MVASKSATSSAEHRGTPKPQPADLEAAPDRDARMAREEQVGGRAIGHEQRRHAGMVPDHPFGRWQCGEPLHRLPEHEDDEQAEERADRGPEDAAAQQEDPHEVDDQGAEHEQGIGAGGNLLEPLMDARGELMKAVTQATFGEASRRSGTASRTTGRGPPRWPRCEVRSLATGGVPCVSRGGLAFMVPPVRSAMARLGCRSRCRAGSRSAIGPLSSARPVPGRFP